MHLMQIIRSKKKKRYSEVGVKGKIAQFDVSITSNVNVFTKISPNTAKLENIEEDTNDPPGFICVDFLTLWTFCKKCCSELDHVQKTLKAF